MNFFKTFLASLLAFIVANILITIFVLMIAAGFAAALGSKKIAATQPNSVLVIDLSNGIVDAPDSSPFKSVGLGGIVVNNSNTIFEVLSAVENAELDKNIRGVYINVTGGSISMANIEELRAALDKFRERSGKFVIAYADSYSQAGYYLSSVADKVFLHPEGNVAWHGLSSHVMFYKGLLDKLGVKVEIVRHGSFKSAVEPFMLDKMSVENRAQYDDLLRSIWNSILADVSLSREIDADALSYYANNLSAMRNAQSAVDLGFIDGLLFQDQVVDLLGRLTKPGAGSVEAELKNIMEAAATSGNEPSRPESAQGTQAEHTVDVNKAEENEIIEENVPNEATDLAEIKEKRHKPNFVKLSDYIATLTMRPAVSGRAGKIAIVYINGGIIDGESDSENAGGATIAQKLSQVRRDGKVKGVVVRVNSPGGSALASDVIWREMELLRREKPVVVSMGAYAASGGYYVSCPADVIVTNRSTLTGSIGVFALLLNVENTLRDKLGITVDVARTNDHADMGSIFRPVKEAEKEFLVQYIERVYTTFVGHVAAGRNMTPEQVDVIGGGRVWSGVTAVEIGLADYTGGLWDAISLCAQNAGLADKDYRVTEIVDTPDAISTFLRMLSSSEARTRQSELGEAFVYYNTLVKMLEQQGVQARMPFVMEVR